MDSAPASCTSDAMKDVIVGNLVDSAAVCFDEEIGDDELAGRYSSAGKEVEDDEDGIRLFRPDDSEIIARYAVKTEPDSDDEIILNHPNDDDIVRRYGGFHGTETTSREGSPTRSMVSDGRTDDETPVPCSNVPFDSREIVQRNGVPFVMDKCVTSDNDELEDTVVDVEANFDSPSSESEIVERSSSRLSPDDETEDSMSEDFEDSCYGSVDATDDAFRALMKPGCSSPRNRNITFFNVCCNKETVSSISIDSLQRTSELSRGIPCRDPTQRQIKLSSLRGSNNCLKENHPLKKSKSRSKSMRCVRSDHLINVIHSLEKIAQNMESHCIEARRSLRRNHSQNNFSKTGLKLKTEIAPLLNHSLVLLRKIRHVP